jgi:hypothetical protein
LAEYERYAKDSRDGKIEHIPWPERCNSAQWLDRHPSIKADPQKWFQVVKAKRVWDEAMSELLSKRNTWDLPDEVDAPTEPEDSLPNPQ